MAECELIYRSAISDIPFGCYVEIGSYMGRTTAVIGYAAAARGRIVYAVDHHVGDVHSGHITDPDGNIASTLYTFEMNMYRQGLERTVVPVVKDSVKAGNEFTQDIAFLFIDGLHEEDACRNDFEAFRPHLLPGAAVCFHDYGRFGVAPVVDGLIAGGVIEKVEQSETLFAARYTCQ